MTTNYDGVKWDHIMIRHEWQVALEIRQILPKADRIMIDKIKDDKDVSYIICWNNMQ